MHQPERSEIVAFDSSTGRYALRTAGVISYADVSEMFEMLNNNESIYVEGAGAIPKMTLWYGEDDTVFVYEGDELCVEQITVSDFNAKLEQIFDTTASQEDYDSVRDNIEKIIMEELIRDEEEKLKTKSSFQDTGSYDRLYSFSAALVHDTHPDVALSYKAKVKNPLGSDDVH